MLTIAQMRQLTGVSRRTLQDYDSLGLLRHRDKTPGGYWLYAEEDVERLTIIQMLHCAGYTRRELQEIVPTPDIAMAELLDRAQASLERKLSQIGALLQHISFLRLQGLCMDVSEQADACAGASGIAKPQTKSLPGDLTNPAGEAAV